MADRIVPGGERLKKMVNNIPHIGCSDCRTTIKQGWLQEDVMALAERVTEEDWKGVTPYYCAPCGRKRGLIK